MKGIIYFLFVFLIVIFASCSSVSNKTVETLQQAEQCMEARPDSALTLLNGISYPDELTGKARADYLLLLTQAHDKNYMDISADSSIVFAIDYFEKEGDKRKYGKSLYYYGRVLQEKQDIAEAMKFFLKARQVLEETEEYKILGLTCVNISILNREQSLYDGAIRDCYQAISYYYQAKDTLGVAYAYQTMGSSFFLKQNMDSVYYCATQSLQLLTNNPIRLKIGAAKMLGMMYCFEEQYVEGEKIFLSIIGEEPDKNKLASHYMSLGRLYQLMGRNKDAEKYLKLCLESRNMFTCSAAYDCLAELAKANHDYERAFMLKDKSDSLLYIAENEKKRETLVQLQADYQKEKLEKEKLQVEMEKRTLQLLYLMMFILFLGVIYFLYNKYWRAKLQIKQIRETLERNNKQIASFQNEIRGYRQREDEKEIEISTKINKLYRKIDGLIGENKELRNKVDVSELMRMLKKGEVIAENLTSKEWDKVFNLANCLHPELLANLQEEFVQLTKHDIKLLAFLLLGFTAKELMIVFDSKDVRTVFKAKSRLKERLGLRKEESVDDFLQKRQEGRFK